MSDYPETTREEYNAAMAVLDRIESGARRGSHDAAQHMAKRHGTCRNNTCLFCAAYPKGFYILILSQLRQIGFVSRDVATSRPFEDATCFEFEELGRVTERRYCKLCCEHAYARDGLDVRRCDNCGADLKTEREIYIQHLQEVIAEGEVIASGE